MEQYLTDISRKAIDAMIDGWVGRPAGITLSFSLCAGFMHGGFLETVDYTVGGEQWRQRHYRGRVVQPDPLLTGYDFFFGMRIYDS
jgi:hypothetical protein